MLLLDRKISQLLHKIAATHLEPSTLNLYMRTRRSSLLSCNAQRRPWIFRVLDDNRQRRAAIRSMLYTLLPLDIVTKRGGGLSYIPCSFPSCTQDHKI